MGFVAKAIGGITSSLFGGDSSPQEGANYAPRTDAENKRLQDIEAQIQALYGNQSGQASQDQTNSNQLTQLFQKQLTGFLAGGSSNPNPTPEQLKQATDFVDQTFTNPAQTALKQYGSDFQSQAQAQAAALGRNPNTDIATQQAIAGEIARQGLGLQSERGSRIAQTAQSLNNDTFNRGLGSLNAGLQGSNFLNGLTQQAFANQMGLLNGRTGLAGFYQADRGLKPTGQTNTSPGLLGSVANGASQISGAIGSIGKAAGAIGGFLA